MVTQTGGRVRCGIAVKLASAQNPHNWVLTYLDKDPWLHFLHREIMMTKPDADMTLFIF